MNKPHKVTTTQWILFNTYFIAEHFLGIKRFNKFLGGNRQSLYDEIGRQLEGSGRGGTVSVPEESNYDISLSEFKKKYIDKFEPVVFKGVAKKWPSESKWSLDYFYENYYDKEVAISDNEGTIDPKNPQKFEVMSLGKYIQELRNGSTKYLKFSRLMDDDPTLKNDLDLDWLRKFHSAGTFAENFLMFIGNSEALTPIHCGFGHSLFIQVTGKKKWILWKPNERIFFDPRAKRRQYNFTEADPYKLDDPQFPLIKYAERYEVTLEPGDVLWFPSHLWHYVESKEGGISVVHKFVYLPDCFRSSKVLSTLFFFSTRPNIFVDFIYLKLTKRDFIYTRGKSQLE
jgi:hypothetical protein